MTFRGTGNWGCAGSKLASREPPRGLAGTQQGDEASAGWLDVHQSSVHSHTLPAMSNNPNPFAGKEPTGAVRRYPDSPVVRHGKSRPSHVLAMITPSGLASSPQVNAAPSIPPRAAYSHSASVGSRPPSHSAKADASSWAMWTTGWSTRSSMSEPGPWVGTQRGSWRPDPPLAEMTEIDRARGRPEDQRSGHEVLDRRTGVVVRVEWPLGDGDVAGRFDELRESCVRHLVPTDAEAVDPDPVGRRPPPGSGRRSPS